MKKNPQLGKHSHNNRESREGECLRLIREFKKLSLQDVALKLNMKVAEIDHLENGRKFYTDSDISKFLAYYEISDENFRSLMSLKVLNRTIANHFLMNL